MGPAYFVLAIMGCGDIGAGCVDIRDTGEIYRSRIECAADSEAALFAATDVAYPEIAVECRQLAPHIAQARLAELQGD